MNRDKDKDKEESFSLNWLEDLERGEQFAGAKLETNKSEEEEVKEDDN